MFCIKCGAEIADTALFCQNCGTRVVRANTPPSIAQPDIPPQTPKPPSAPHYAQAPQTPQTGSPYSTQPPQPSYPTQKPPRKKKGGCLGKLFLGMLASVVLFGGCLMLLPEDDYDTDPTQGGSFGTSDGTTADLDNSGTYGESLALTDLRAPYTTIKGDGTDTYTIMVYLIGSDLETYGGCATEDIYEMLDANFGDNVNLILMTGGSMDWSHWQVSSDTCQMWQVKDGELCEIYNDLGLLNMASTDTLSWFIDEATTLYPANRYGLILWNHGGGTISGYGYDEYYPDSGLTLSCLEDVFASVDAKFDFIGFDACLMATAEVAYMLEPYADYLIASEETEPGYGWYYTDWLTALGADTSMPTVDLGVEIIDSFVEECYRQSRTEATTLSIVDLREMPHTYQMLCDYFANATVALGENQYQTISNARSNAKDFGEGEFEQVDIIDFIRQTDIAGGEDLMSAIGSAVKYYNNSPSMEHATGLAMYFPYDYPDYYSEMQSVLFSVGYDETYTGFFNRFISILAGGQMHRSGTGAHDFADQSWYDSDTVASYQADYESTDEYDMLPIVEKGDGFVLQLSDAQWERMTGIEMQVLLDDGEGYIDLGSDNCYEWDADGDLMIAFDYTWLAIDGNLVPYYVKQDIIEASDGSWSTYGIVPACLNGETYIEVLLYWDDENPEGYVAGYRICSEFGAPAGKGLFAFAEGDSIEWICDYYDYDLYYQESYMFGEPYTVTGEEMTVSYESAGELDACVYFVLTDIYNNQYYTESVMYQEP